LCSHSIYFSLICNVHIVAQRKPREGDGGRKWEERGEQQGKGEQEKQKEKNYINNNNFITIYK